MKKKIPSKKALPQIDQNTVLLEDIKSQLRVFGEGLNGLTKTVVQMNGKLDNAMTEIIFIKTDVSEIKNDLKKLDARVALIEKKVESMSIDMSEIRKEIKDIRKSMKDKVDADDFEYLEERVVRLEKRLAHA